MNHSGKQIVDRKKKRWNPTVATEIAEKLLLFFFLINFLPEFSTNEVITLALTAFCNLPSMAAYHTALGPIEYCHLTRDLAASSTLNYILSAQPWNCSSISIPCWLSMGSRLNVNSDAMRKRIESRKSSP